MSKWRELREYVEENITKLFCQKFPDADLRGYQILKPGMEAKASNYLYIVDVDAVDEIKLCSGCSVALLSESEIPEEFDVSEYMTNCMAVCGKSAIYNFLSRANELFQLDSDVVNALLKMQLVINQGGGVQKLVDILAELLGLTVDILDNSLTFVATSSPYKDLSPLREQHIRSGVKPPQDELDYFRKTGVLEKLTNAAEPIVVHSAHYTTWTIPIMYNWMKIGYISIFDLPEYAEPRMNRAFLPYLPSIATLFGIEMGKREFNMLNKATFYTHIMETILSGSDISVQEIRDQLKTFDYILGKNMYLITVAPDSMAPRGKRDAVLQDYLSRIFHNSIYVSQEFRWIFLVSRSDRHPVTYDEFNEWNEYLRANNLCAGMTGPFNDFSDMPTRREETELALEFGKRYPRQSITWFDDHQVDALVEHIRRKGTVSRYCYRPVMELMRYDEEHGGELLLTLKEYMAHPKDIAALCKKIHIHRNTLYSRLEKIKSIMNCDINNAEEIMKIQLTFHLLGIQNKEF